MRTHQVTKPARNLRKTLDSIAANNQSAALDVMRTIDQLGDEVLCQRLLEVVRRLNLDAEELHHVRDELQSDMIKLA
jgi:hypothetical protein